VREYAASLELLQEAMLMARPASIMPRLENSNRSLEKRLNIYIAGYRTRLVQVVLGDYPALVHYLGMKTAEKLVLGYIQSTVPTSYTLDSYPVGFSRYIINNGNNGFAAAVAELESAIVEVFWLPDSKAFTPPANLTIDRLAESSFMPRKAARLLELEYPAEEYLGQLREKKEPYLPKACKSYILVLRHENLVKRYILGYAEYLVLSGLLTGTQLGVVLEKILGSYPALTTEIENSVQHWFARWVGNGFFIGEENV
jgi:hypothetical protein